MWEKVILIFKRRREEKPQVKDAERMLRLVILACKAGTSKGKYASHSLTHSLTEERERERERVRVRVRACERNNMDELLNLESSSSSPSLPLSLSLSLSLSLFPLACLDVRGR